MYRKCSFIRKVVHYVLILSLLLTTIAPGFSPMEVLAEDEPVLTGTESVFYVDGVNGNDNDETYDGSSAAKAFKTLTKAYNNVPQDNTETTIVICGNVNAYEGALELKTDYYRFPAHTGKVIITSVYGEENYTSTATIDFGGKYYYFLGDTTFENVSISSKASRIFANYFPLHLGKGITVKDLFADSIYMGTSTDINGTGGNKTSVSVADTSFTMESGATGMVLGGGNSWQGEEAKGKDNKVTITINGGTVSTLYGSGAGGTDNAHHKSVEITVNAGGTVTNLYGAHGTATIYNDVSININGGAVTNLYGACKYTGTGGNEKYTPHIEGDVIVTLTGGTITNLYAKEEGADVRGDLVLHYLNAQNVTLPTAMGFNTLKLTNASVTVPSLDSATTNIEATDNSKLTLSVAPTAAVSLTLSQSGDEWNTDDALITAPVGTAEEMFVLTNQLEEYSLKYTSTESNATWGLAKSEENEGGEGSEDPAPTTQTVFYVDGVNGNDNDETYDGSSAAKAFKTLTKAYNNVPQDNTETTIVICGNVNAYEGALNLKDNYYRFTAHPGKVIITSVYGQENYTGTATIDFEGKYYFFLGDTTFENVSISSKASRIFANYFPLHLGKGITVKDLFADSIYMGTSTDINGTGGNKTSVSVADTSFTMESGATGMVLGGGNSWQGEEAKGKDNKVTITINGGTVSTLYGSGAGGTDNAHHKSVEITVNAGGTVTNLYGAHGDATIYNDVSININGGTINNLYGACKYTGTGGNKKYTPHIEGDVIVTLTSGTITNLYAKEEGADVRGDLVLHYLNAQNVTLPTAQGFNTLKMTSAAVKVPAGMEALWSNITQLQMTDDSSLTLESVPNPPAQKVGVTFTKSGDAWNTTNAVITAPNGTADIFKARSPLNVLLRYDDTGVSWTLEESCINIGDKGTAGEELKINLGLPEDGSYTTIPEDATLYETYLQKVEDLGEAKEEVNVIAPIEVKGEIEIYVSPDGDDENSGSINAPLKTISKAMEYVAYLQEDGLVQGIVVYLRAGTYVVSETIALNEKHSGKNNIPVFISAYNDEEVVLSGAMNIAGQEFKSAQTVNKAVYNRLQEGVRDQIVAVDLKELGITKFGQIITGQQGAGGAQYQVYVNGDEFTLARYPNDSKLLLRGKILDIGRIIYGYGDWPAGTNSESTGIEFEMMDLRPTTWYNDGNIWLYGSLYAEWQVEDLRVAEIREKSIKLDHGSYLGAKASPSNTYFYYNVLEELDVPGEFYLDNTNGILYLYPTGDMSNATVNYTLLDGNLFNLDKTKNLILNGLTFDTISAVAVSMSNCEQTIVQNCTIRKVGKGVVIDGKKNGVIYTDIYNFSERGVEFKTAEVAFDFTKALNFVQNCYIYNTSEVKSETIYFRGTGNVLSHNLIQNSYANGINVNLAKECIIEYNEIVGGPTSVQDAAAIYQAGERSNCGNHYRYNYIHDISKYSNEKNPSSIYLDEGLSGSYVYGNIMRNVPCGFYTNSGNNHVIVNNVVMDGRTGSLSGLRSENNHEGYTITYKFNRSTYSKDNYATYFSMSDAKRAEVKGRYPLESAYYEELQKIIEEHGMDYTGFYVCHGNYVADNLLYDCGTTPINFLGVNHEIKDSNVIADADPFVDAVNHNYQLKDSGLIAWQIVSMDKVGITREKKGIDSFELCIPADEEQAVDPANALFRWTFAEGADTYTLTLATDEALTENVKEVVLEGKTSATLEDLALDTTYYWKVTANTVAESRIATPVSTAAASFKTLSEIPDSGDGDGDGEAGDAEVVGNVHITFEGLGREHWTDPQYFVDANFDDSDELKLLLRTDLVSTIDRGELVYGLGLGTREILHFQYKLDELESWNGFFLAQSNTDVWGTSAKDTDAYFICIKPDQFELQKRKDGASLGNLAVVQNNREIFDGGGWYDITCGTINNEDGSVRILFMVNDTVVFDYVDEENAIVGETGFGVLVPKGNKNGFAHIKKADVTDTSELLKLITEAETFATQITEESNGGQYYDGTTKALQDAIAKALAIVEQVEMPKQDVVDAEVAELEAALYTARVSRDVQDITFEGLGSEHWSDPQYYVDADFADSDELKLLLRTDLVSTIDRGELVYGLGLGTREILHFQYKLDELESWNGFFLAQSNTDVWGTSAKETDAYFICIKPDQFELQKRKDGASLGNLAVVQNNREIFDGGEWYDITCGTINNEDGSVRILFMVNDTVVFDYVDEENAIVGETGFGVLVPKGNKNGFAHIKKAELTEPTPTSAPTATPTSAPTATPTSAPTATPTSAPTAAPTSAPTAAPTSAPVDVTITEVKASEAVVEAVKENVIVSNSTATVNKTALEAVVEATKENEAVVLPLTEVTTEVVNKAEISAEALNAVAEKQADVVIEFSEITVKLDAEAVEAITEQAKGATIEIRAVKTEVNTLTEAQKTALESKEVAIVVTAQVFSDGEYIGDFKEGKATVMIPFTPDSGKEAEHYKVYYIDEAGVLKEVAAEYVSGYMVFTTPHFSDYVIVYEGAMGEDTTPTPSPEDDNDSDDSNDNGNSEIGADTTSTTTTPGTGDNSNIFIWIALFAAAVVSGGFLIKKRIKK